MYNNITATRSTVTKVGVALINNAGDEIFEYRSTLFKSSSSVKESLLQMLYGQKKRWPKFVIDGL